MTNADRSAATDEVGGAGFEADVAAGAANRRAEIGIVGPGARRIQAEHVDSAGDDIDDEDVAESIGVAEDQIGGRGLEGDIAAVGADDGAVARAVGLFALAGEVEAARGIGLVIEQEDVASAVGVAGDEVAGVGGEDGVATIGTSGGVIAVAVARSRAGGARQIVGRKISRLDGDARSIHIEPDVVSVLSEVTFGGFSGAIQRINLGEDVIRAGKIAGNELIPGKRNGRTRVEFARSVVKSESEIICIAVNGITREHDLDAKEGGVARA